MNPGILQRSATTAAAALAACLLLAPVTLRAETHALIMSIGDYAAPVPKLPDSQLDVDNARNIAQRLGALPENIRHYRDAQLTRDGILGALRDFTARLQPNDQAFIYYSGHGGRSLVKDPEVRCAESLITVDGNAVYDFELERILKNIGTRADKVVTLIDACHSGGVTTRASSPVPGAGGLFPKFWARDSGPVCDVPTNVLTRGLNEGMRKPGSGAANFVYIAAARADEVSLGGQRGGLATLAVLDCLSSKAADTDGSGAISAEEARNCAQPKIEASIKPEFGYRPHHVSIAGNAAQPLALLALAPAPAAAPAVAAPVTAPAPSTTAPAQSTATPAQSATATASPAPAPAAAPVPTQKPHAPAALADIYNRRDDRRTVKLETGRPNYRVGKDSLTFNLSSSHAGYVYVLHAGSDGSTFDVLFPNRVDANNQVRENETLQLPRAGWSLPSRGPAGKNQLLVLVADAQRDFSKLGMQPSGPFSNLPATGNSVIDVQSTLGKSAFADGSDCRRKTALDRLLAQVLPQCSNAYGAALAVVEEVNE